jgi:hypothetical protein
MTDADLKLIARVSHSVADQLGKSGDFYGTLDAAFFGRLIEFARSQGREQVRMAVFHVLIGAAPIEPEKGPETCGACGEWVLRDRMLGTRCGCSPDWKMEKEA